MKVYFTDKRRLYWVREISKWVDRIPLNTSNEKKELQIFLDSNITKNDFSPFHIVLLSCFISFIESKGYDVNCYISDNNLHSFISNNLFLDRYINEKSTTYIKETEDNNLNLWKIVDNRAKEYSIRLTEYLQRNYFKNLDLSGVQNTLDEIYANVADHAKANGIAFSYINYNPTDRRIKFAVCDFGLGIPTTLRSAYPTISDDSQALKNSTDIGITSKSNSHNRGFGLDNVLSNLMDDGNLCIISNKAILLCKGNKINMKTYPLDFEFKGTLIYFEIPVDSFEVEETIDFDIEL